MNRTSNTLAVLSAFGILSVMWVIIFATLWVYWPDLFKEKEPHQICDVGTVIDAMITIERPSMGRRESEFWRDAIVTAGHENQIPPVLLAALVAEETRFHGTALSYAGAIGAAQIMPLWTGHDLCPQDKHLDEIEDNLGCGARILKKYIAQDGSIDAGLRRYNAGRRQHQVQRYADAVLARVARAQAKACPSVSHLLSVATNDRT